MCDVMADERAVNNSECGLSNWEGPQMVLFGS